jgi:hypothetical protein
MAIDSPPDPPDRGTSPRRIILGFFVTFQLAFLVLSNLIGLYQDPRPVLNRVDPAASEVLDRVAPGYPSETGHAWRIPDEASTLLRRWAQLTAQDQNWSLFAPGVYTVTGFPAVLFVWEEPLSAEALARTTTLLAARDGCDAAALATLLDLQPGEFDPPAVQMGPGLAPLALAHPEVVGDLQQLAHDDTRTVRPVMIDLFLSDNEPADARRFVRLGQFRLRRYEGGVIPYLREQLDKEGKATEEPAAMRERWRGEIRTHVENNTDFLLIYLKWRMAVYRERHPDRPQPRQVILIERGYKILAPELREEAGDPWIGPTMVALARWQPDAKLAPGQRPLERYNLVDKRFETSWK